MPKVSIILPCYNVEKYIAKSIQSILDQTYSNFEILVVIDGSPDNTLAIAQSFTDKRIIIFDKPNGGLSDARNYGLERAKGEFIYFMDPDDWIEPNLLEDNLKIIEQKQLDFVVFGYFQDSLGYSENLISTMEYIPKVKAYYKDKEEPKIDNYHVGLLGYAWNKIYRKSFLKNNNFEFIKGVSLVEDILFNAPIYKASEAIYFNQKAYYHYIDRIAESQMKRYRPDFLRLYKMKFEVLKSWLDTWKVFYKQDILSTSIMGGIRYSIDNIFTSKNELSFLDKHKMVKTLFNEVEITKNINYFQPKSLKDRVFKFLVKHKMSLTTSFIAEFIK
ncbi:glycosyltransferase family 2 protein [Aequorivita sinensis]|uniref:glycosyltransferase family 2 protein n=1 Tax=Aequorivita sinensis TaxID=1382458 RepID=UPI0011214118|nr:glycosyltransferase family 2 protein [Aequorivita sinensis]